MRIAFQIVFSLALWAASSAVGHAEWRATERVETYAVSGTTAPELYASIGARGPKVGIGRAIAYTDFKLTWTRDYQRQGDACTLVTAVPKLIVTYRIPEPSARLSTVEQARWDRFAEGIRAHERRHGEIIVEMVRKIEAATVGLSVPGDPNCRKIRQEMTRRLSALSQEQRQRSRDFDRVEMSNGGNVHQLILAFVNGN